MENEKRRDAYHLLEQADSKFGLNKKHLILQIASGTEPEELDDPSTLKKRAALDHEIASILKQGDGLIQALDNKLRPAWLLPVNLKAKIPRVIR